MVTISYAAIAVAAIINFALGALWYSPILFAKPWQKLVGKTSESDVAEMQKLAPQAMIQGFISILVMSYVLAHFVAMLSVNTINDAVQLGVWIWLGFVATNIANLVFYEKRKWAYFWIVSSYQLAALIIMSIVLVLWP